MREVQDRPGVSRAPDSDAKVRADEEEAARTTLFVLGAVAGLLLGILIMGIKLSDAYDYIHELETSYETMNRRFYHDFYENYKDCEHDDDEITNGVETYLH